VGFFLVTGHGVNPELRARVREQARAFFALPDGIKQQYAVTVGGRGWLPPGVEANGYAEGTETPPGLKESFAVGADRQTRDTAAPGGGRAWAPTPPCAGRGRGGGRRPSPPPGPGGARCPAGCGGCAPPRGGGGGLPPPGPRAPPPTQKTSPGPRRWTSPGCPS